MIHDLSTQKGRNKYVEAMSKTKLEKIQDTMDFNGYCYFHAENYKAKNDKPCFISENDDTPYSYQELFKEVLETVKTKDFLLAVAENYDYCDYLNDEPFILEDSSINFEDVYLEITEETPEQFAETFMDNYFLGGDEVWCSISTKLQDYMM